MFYYFIKLDLVLKLNTRMNSYRTAALRVYVALLLQGLSQTISFLYQSNCDFYDIHFEITGYPCNLIGYQQCDLFPNRTIFCSKSHLCLRQWEGDIKTKQLIRFQGFFLTIQSHCRKMKDKKATVWQIWQLLLF